MTRFEVMSLEEARKIVERSHIALAALRRGETDSADARAMSFQSDTYDDRLAAQRRLRSVTDDLTRDEYRAWKAAKDARFEAAMNAAKRRRYEVKQ